eukprot:32862-Hanusia_phi.AAC.1
MSKEGTGHPACAVHLLLPWPRLCRARPPGKGRREGKGRDQEDGRKGSQSSARVGLGQQDHKVERRGTCRGSWQQKHLEMEGQGSAGGSMIECRMRGQEQDDLLSSQHEGMGN